MGLKYIGFILWDPDNLFEVFCEVLFVIFICLKEFNKKKERKKTR